MPLPPVPTANTLVERYGAQGYIDPLKLQKLLYFANGWYLALTGGPLVSERPEVWRYGPVFRSVYASFARYGNSRITAVPAGPPVFGNAAPVALNPQDVATVGPFLDWLWGEYGWRDGTDLSDETHATGTPWQRIAAANDYDVRAGTYIKWRDDYAYFVGQAAQRGWTTQPLNPAFAAG